MKTTTTTHPAALRLLAALFFLLLLAPIAAGEEASPPPTYWEDYLNGVDKLANDKGGDGTKGNPILIATAKELAYFAQQVNSKLPITYGSGTDKIEPGGNRSDIGGFFDYYFALSADINLEKHYWTPIGTKDNPFKGYFDGKGHCVSGLKVKVIENDIQGTYAGLFGNAHNGTIQNLGVCLAKEGVRATNANTMGGNLHAGGIAGQALNVYNCYLVGEGSIEINGGGEGNGYAGGIVGYLYGSGLLTNCYATVDIRIETNGIRYAGGIAGYCNSNSTISYTYATGDVEIGTGGNLYYAGGICGYLNTRSKIENSLALNGRITGGDNFSNRIVGHKETYATSTTNYASPDIVVNDKTVSGGGETDANGDPNVNLDIFDKVFSGGAGWDTSDKTHLPKLKIRTGDGPGYDDWPTGEDFTPQSPPDATQYLQADKIANAGSGNGLSWKNAIQIANRAELVYLAKQVNAKGNLAVAEGVDGGSIANKTYDDSGFKGIYFALAADIDLREKDWTPIGTDSNPFQGNFDGAGHKVEGLVVNVDVVSNSAYAGLFGYLYDGATIRNLGIRLGEAGVKATVSTTGSRTTLVAYAGGLAGKLSSGTIISNCYVEGEACVKATSPYVTYAGGLVGYTLDNVTITHCYTTVNVSTDGLQNGQCGAGGIVGILSGKISYTYATGTVDAKGVTYAGGICGKIGTNGTITNSLALNTAINGLYTGRIVGNANDNLTSNYATPLMQLSGQTSSDNQVDNENGANTWPGSFEADLKKEPAGDANGWATSWTFTSGYLPQLMKKTADGYEAWGSEQPQLKTNLYFPSRPKLHIVSPTGGTLTVKDKDKKELPNGSDILPGTLLTLAYTEEANYCFSEYLSGSDKSSLKSYGSNSITMTDEDLYLSATFTLYPKLHIVSSTGGTLEVMDKDGNKLPDGSYIRPGTVLTLANTEEANYYFSEYLSGSDKGSLKSYDSNSITMTDDDLYLSATFTLYPKLHIVSSTGGTLTVTDKDGNKLPDGSNILPGTVLTLAYTEEANYRFSEHLSGSDKSSLKSYGSNSITMPDADLYLSATFTYQEPEPPYVPPTPVYYSVYLPQVEGATTDPGSGKYEVESRDSFRFYLKIDSAYSESQPVVTTDRGETLKPRSSDGAYLVNDVCSDVEVFIDGIFKNPPPVANEAISTDALVPQIWAEGSMLCIRMPEALPSAPVHIFTVDGRLYASFDSTPGLNRRQLPTGIYIVWVGDTVCKVIVK